MFVKQSSNPYKIRKKISKQNKYQQFAGKKDEEHTEIINSIIQRIMKEYNTNNEEIDDVNIIPFNANERIEKLSILFSFN